MDCPNFHLFVDFAFRLMLSTIVDVIFLIDVVLQFITMYPRPTQSGVVWEQKVSRIAKHYATWWLKDWECLEITRDWWSPTIQKVQKEEANIFRQHSRSYVGNHFWKHMYIYIFF